MTHIIDKILDNVLGKEILRLMSSKVSESSLIESLEDAYSLLYGDLKEFNENETDIVVHYPYDSLKEANEQKEKLIKLLKGEITYTVHEETDSNMGFDTYIHIYKDMFGENNDNKEENKNNDLSLEENEIITIARRLLATYSHDSYDEFNLFILVVIYLREDYSKLEFILNLIGK